MKTITFIILLLSLAACRSVKDRQKAVSSLRQTATESSSYRIAGEWQWYDSTRRHWYYRTDSSFFYHPDSGLLGNTGILWVQESRHQAYTARQTSDSISTQVQENHQLKIQESVRTSTNSWLRYVVLTVLALLTVFLAWKGCKQWITGSVAQRS